MAGNERETEKGGAEGGSGPAPSSNGIAESPWEWATAALGAVIVAGLLGYVGHHAVSDRSEVPSVAVEAAETVRAGDSHVVRFRVLNGSSATAAALLVSGELRDGQIVVERSEARIDYLPPFSEREGGLLFRADPGAYELVIRPEGYSEP
ncbi:TIGR02588 family protein [Propylenella binzhouense]|uniref:TIGR02588 family protein n=1 Tax=Propylenella binzhouense TaxID=2555902 RepID=A0A964WUK9_9HYPH|nr:TIGR02588 family protein [Propylenella binzhouense]MYZ48950.1 TIGR02588 family protein [Propylenella binzhouense]